MGSKKLTFGLRSGSLIVALFFPLVIRKFIFFFKKKKKKKKKNFKKLKKKKKKKKNFEILKNNIKTVCSNLLLPVIFFWFIAIEF
ncbi:hypothetical protein RhiirA1_75669 [Rhizophagus irregularis]|uniref:Uncharacterized protein n=1 Tax=Rhizophagus irregularis TaxID=588596 RepID=A0A2N0R2S1_9GLOM|nr:hypothetical protein RhiirA1_75669 [Rhizophagus irregularis]